MGSGRVWAAVLCFLVVCCGSGLCVILPANGSEAGALNSTLELLHVVFRHGPRTPVNTYPNDPYVNEKFYPFGWGHLTNDAKKELFELGKWLRQRYATFLEPYYYNDLLFAQSTASPRTLMSMAAVLASLFAPKNTPLEWNSQLNWQPVPIYSEPLERDILLRMTAKCPRYDEALEEVLHLPEVREELAAHEFLFENLSEITGLNVTSAADINSIYITLLAEESYGLTLPEWTENYFPGQMQFMAEKNYIYNAYTTEMRKIKGGPFLQKMFREMQERAAGVLKPEGRKLYAYCAHDWSITNILSALNVWKQQIPRFSALIAFELRKDVESGHHFVEIYLKNDPHLEPKKLTVPGCELQCPLEQLIELSSAVIPDASYEEMCLPKNN